MKIILQLRDLIEIVLIFVGAFLFYEFIKFVLGNPYPLVVVVSGSMMHLDDINQKHYEFLERSLGYNRSFIESWPLRNGFGIGDILVVYKTNELKVGDVIVFRNYCENIPIAHRIIAINSDGTLQTKGDNNFGQNVWNCYDERRIRKEDVYGKVIFVIPKIGLIRYFIYEIFGF